jgi:hypothetical protein
MNNNLSVTDKLFTIGKISVNNLSSFKRIEKDYMDIEEGVDLSRSYYKGDIQDTFNLSSKEECQPLVEIKEIILSNSMNPKHLHNWSDTLESIELKSEKTGKSAEVNMMIRNLPEMYKEILQIALKGLPTKEATLLLGMIKEKAPDELPKDMRKSFEEELSSL